MLKAVTILGSTGSIGTQVLDIARHFKNTFTIHALSAGNNIELLRDQIVEFQPKHVCIKDKQDYDNLNKFIKTHKISCSILVGNEGLIQLSSIKVDLFIVSLVGTSGIAATFKALDINKNIALACKEVLVSAGDIIMKKAKEKNVNIIPIDSEHAAIQQCMHDKEIKDIHKIILTASGGPFLNKTYNEFKNIQIQDALKHPKWSMGNKISIDSSTLVNKGLEVIEAHHLFNIEYDKIDVLVHKQSIVHGIVEFLDGNILSHISPTDMRFPIQYAMTYPNIKKTPFQRFHFNTEINLTFDKPNHKKFPLLNLAIECGKKKKSYPIVFNAANEAAVNQFLNKNISYLEIHKIIEKKLNSFKHYNPTTIEDIINIDSEIKYEIFSNS